MASTYGWRGWQMQRPLTPDVHAATHASSVGGGVQEHAALQHVLQAAASVPRRGSLGDGRLADTGWSTTPREARRLRVLVFEVQEEQMLLRGAGLTAECALTVGAAPAYAPWQTSWPTSCRRR